MKTPEYWSKRFNLLEQSQHDRGAEAFSEIDRKYRKTIREIERKIAVWYQRFADNNGISLQEAQKWLTEKELEEFKWDVQEYIRYGQENAIDGAWAKQLENASARLHISRLEALKIQCQQDIEVLFGGQKDILDQAMSDVYRSAYYRTAFEVQRGVGVGWDFATLDSKTISKIINKPWAVDGTNFSDRIWSNKQKLLSELDSTLTQNVVLGQDPQKAIDSISYRLGVSKANAGRLVMTEEAYFASEAQKNCFEELDVEQYEIVATLDSRTSEICRMMDGKVFKMFEWKVGATAPPFHPWCRTTTVPHFNDEFDVGERAARNKDGNSVEVPESMTYEEWKRKFLNEKDSQEELKFVSSDDNIVDIKFKSQKPSSEVREDKKTVIEAYVSLPPKVQNAMSDVTVELGNFGSACDYVNGVIYVASNAEKEEIYHEFGHLVEYRMMNPADVEAYKQYLVDGLTDADITQEIYYNTAGQPQSVYIVHGSRFVSEYQGRIYVNSLLEAVNTDGSIKTEKLFEAISEPFRMYQNKQLNEYKEIYDFIEMVVK